jgi:hypothetical protein
MLLRRVMLCEVRVTLLLLLLVVAAILEMQWVACSNLMLLDKDACESGRAARHVSGAGCWRAACSPVCLPATRE